MTNRHWLLLILLLGFMYRAPQLDAPILGEHSWRQADTAAMARNFTENGYQILYPQIDWGGETEGGVESEFPLYPFMVALLYGLFGVSEFWPRALSVFFSLLTILFLYRLTRDYVDEPTALWAGVFYAILPLSALFGRAVMPESLMLMASISGVYYFANWTRMGGAWNFLASTFLISIACLVKLPCLYLGAPLLFLAWIRWGSRSVREPRLWFYAFVVLVPVFLWYWHAHQIFEETGLTFGIWEHGSDKWSKWGNWDLVFSGEYWNRILLNRLAHRHLTWFGFAVFLVGFFLKRRSSSEFLFDAWISGLAVYLIVVGVGNYSHNYYQLPLLLPVTVFMGKVYARYFRLPLPRSLVAAVLCVLLILIAAVSALRLYDYRLEENSETSSEFALAEELARRSDSSDKVISITNDPTVLYLAHRKGWKSSLEALRLGRVRRWVNQGAKYVVGIHEVRDRSEIADQRFRSLLRHYRLVVNNDAYFIIHLEPRSGVPSDRERGTQRSGRGGFRLGGG